MARKFDDTRLACAVFHCQNSPVYLMSANKSCNTKLISQVNLALTKENKKKKGSRKHTKSTVKSRVFTRVYDIEINFSPKGHSK